jgi:hypothetical protein
MAHLGQENFELGSAVPELQEVDGSLENCHPHGIGTSTQDALCHQVINKLFLSLRLTFILLRKSTFL